MEGGEDVDDGAGEDEDSGELELHADAVHGVDLDAEDVEEEGVDEEGEEADQEEDPVPRVQDLAGRI